MNLNAPWESEECFPEKPATSDFGYLERSKLVPCTREELIERCAGLKRPEIELVWHSDAPRLVPVWTVGFLGNALLIREKTVLKQNRRVAAFNVLILFVFWALAHGQKGSVVLVVFFGLFFGVLPLYQSWRDLRRIDHVKWDTTTAATSFDRYAAWVETRSDTMTRLLLGIITLVGILQVVAGYRLRPHGAGIEMPSIMLAGLIKESVRHGEWWRLFTAPLLHGSLVHFIFNATALFGLGRLTEALAGRSRLAMVFALSALGGSLFSQLAMPNTASVGASGGLLGLIGFLMLLGYRRKALLPPGFLKVFVLNVALVAVMGIAARSIVDNAAHFGGFAAGVAIAAFTVPRQGGLPVSDTRTSNISGILSFGSILGFALVAAGKMFGKF